MTHEMEIRKFTDRGIDRFSEYLAALNVGSTVSPPYDLLTDPQTSTPALADIAIERRIFHTRLDAARYLDDILADTDRDAVQDDIHLWGWLSLFYFDQVCPVDPRNRRRPGRSYRHILEPGYPYGHRHLIHGAFLVYTAYGWGEELSRLLLSTPLHTESMFHHEIAGRQNLITNRGVMEGSTDSILTNPPANPGGGP